MRVDDSWEWIRRLLFLSPLTGYIWLVLSAIAGGFGNSLEPVSSLAFLSSSFLLIGLHLLFFRKEETTIVFSLRTLLILLFVVFSQASGFCFAFSSVFAYPSTTPLSIFTTFIVGVLVWTLYALLSILPHLLFYEKYPRSWATGFIFPITNTTLNITLIGRTFSTFTAVGNALLDISPLKQFSSLFGMYGLNFTICLGGTLFGLRLWLKGIGAPERERKSLRSVSGISLTIFLVLCTITGFIQLSDQFYQVDASDMLTSQIPVSCIFAQNAEKGSSDWDAVWNNTRQRVEMGDSIILMAEGTFQVSSDEEENEILAIGQQIAMGSPSLSTVYLGISYLKTPPDVEATNHFALVSSDPNIPVLWNYRKAFPVPLVEANVQAGPAVLPVHDSVFGKLGGAICFDMDYPSYILQAGQQKVDLLLQPSWTWGAILSRHFEGDAVRAVENGFTLFRCSSMGESGVVDRRGKLLHRQFTGDDPNVVAIFSIPLVPRTETVYVVIGFVIEWIGLIFSIVFCSFAFLPKTAMRKFAPWL